VLLVILIILYTCDNLQRL